jgi:uncharacterized protein (DUF4415 family)
VRFADNRRPYGEERWLALGRIGERLHTLVYTNRAGRTRVISLRRSKSQEVAVMRKRLIRPTPEEDAAIQRGIDADPDTWEVTQEDFARMRPVSEVHPDIVADYLRRKRGAQKTPTKVLVSLRLEREVVERLRASGRGWQSRANNMLRKAVLGS